MAPRSATENRMLAEADKARKEATAEVTALRRQLEAEGLKPKQIQSDPRLLAAQAKLEEAKSAAGLLTTEESLRILNRGAGPGATDTRLAGAGTRRREEVMAGFRETPDFRTEQFQNSLFNTSTPPAVTPPPGYRWILGGGRYPMWSLQASREAKERDDSIPVSSALGWNEQSRMPWDFDPNTNSFVFRPTRWTPQSAIDQFQPAGSTGQEVVGSTMRLPTVNSMVDGGGPSPSNINTAPGGGNYTFEDISTITPTNTGNVASPSNMRSARDGARLLAEQYGLGGDFFSQIEQFLFEDMSEASLLMALRATDAYKKRFAANASRVAKGLPALSESAYLNMENLYRNELRAAGLPPAFYDNQDDFKTYIENDISYNEFVSRVAIAKRASQMANPEVKQQLKDLYKIGESDLVAYFLNPDKTTNMLQRQFNVAQTAGALSQAGFGTGMAEELTTAVTAGRPETVLDFGELTQAAETAAVARPLSQEVLGGEGGAVAEQDILRGIVAEDVQSQRRLQREQQRRLAEYQGGGTLAESQQGVIGLRSAAR